MTQPAEDALSTLAVLMVNFGTHELVEANLRRSLGPDFPGSVVVVDSFSDLDERQALGEVCLRNGWTCLALDTNPGFGGGNNRAAEAALRLGCTELLMLNPDAWLDLETVRSLQEQVRQDPMTLVAPVVVRPDGRLFSAEVDLHLDRGEMLGRRKRPPGTPEDRVHTWVSGACLMISSRLWRGCGGFDEEYFLYWEDVDLCRRIVEAGGGVRVDDSCRAVHDEGSSHGFDGPPRAKSPIYYYYNTRNRLMYAAKHLGRDDQRRWARATPRVSYRILLQGGRRQLVRPGRSLWPAVKGSWHGLRYLRTHRRD
jgi:GT2 family glycosyltransferase